MAEKLVMLSGAMSRAAACLGLLGLGLGLAWAGLWWLERACLYAPRRDLGASPASGGLRFDELRFAARDGTRLHGWLVPAASPGAPGILFFHGNAGNIGDRLDKLLLFHALGFSVLIFDYRGYGLSEGSPSEEGTYLDGEAAAAELESRLGGRPGGEAYYGESLGCAVALETALRRPPAALILDSGFTSTADMARRLFPGLPAGRLVRNRYDNISKIGKLKAPLLVVHSPDDEIVPFAMGRRLFEAAPEPKEFFSSKGDHNGGFLASPGFPGRIGTFLRRRLTP